MAQQLTFAPGTIQCGLNEQYERELLQNITDFGLWHHLPIYPDLMSTKEIVNQERLRWKDKYGNDSTHRFPKYLVTNHFGSYCAFSRAFFPVFFQTASSFGTEAAIFVLLESKSPWYFSTRQSVTGIPDIRLYQIDNEKPSLLGQYITSGPRSYEGFSYWLNKYTKYERDRFPLLIPRPFLYKEASRNRVYYQDHYQHLKVPDLKVPTFDPVNTTTFEFDRVVQVSSILDNDAIGFLSLCLTLTLVAFKLINWIKWCCTK